MNANNKGLLDGQEYGSVVLEFNEQTQSARVYNVFGIRSVGGCGIRVSSILAESLGLKLEDRVKIFRK